jgi:hypothetical protein
MKLIIGKNSRIVQGLSLKNNLFKTISHTELDQVNLKKYTEIYLFSWAKKENDNLIILKKLPIKKVFFVSTIAVYSINHRHQWNSYPINKKNIENYVLSKGGRLIRLGFYVKEKSVLRVNIAPFTDNQQILDFIDSKKNKQQKIVNLFQLKNFNKISFYTYVLHKASYFFSFLPKLRIIFEVIPKFLKDDFYGYTADTLYYFRNEILIGFGVLGSAFYYNKKEKPLVIASPKSNEHLNRNGFHNTILGFDYIGLAKLWHGVSIIKKNNKYYKKVPLMVSRERLPSSACHDHVTSVSFQNNFFEIQTKSKQSFYTRRLSLACGPIQNTLLLKMLCSYNKEVKFSDHELHNIGYMFTNEAISKGFIKKFGPFIFRSHLLRANINQYKVLLEFRPRVIIINEDERDIYLNTTSNIIKKIILNFNFSRLNEAFFNKFGFAFTVNQTDIVAQVLIKNCIVLTKENKLIRKRVTKNISSKLSLFMHKKFLTFNDYKLKKSIDSQHICGGAELLKNKEIKWYLENNKIKIMGSPTNRELDEFHHTHSLISDTLKLDG